MKYVWKRTLCLMLCALFCAALFTGCTAAPGGKDSTDTAVTEGTTTPDSAPLPAVEETVVTNQPRDTRALLLETDFQAHLDELNYTTTAFADGRLYMRGERTEGETAHRVLVSCLPDGTDTQALLLTPPAADASLLAAPPEGERVHIGYQLLSGSGSTLRLLRSMVYTPDTDEGWQVRGTEWYLCEADANGALNEGTRLDIDRSEGAGLSFLCEGDGVLWFSASCWDESGTRFTTHTLMGFSAVDGSLTAVFSLPDEVLNRAGVLLTDGRLVYFGWKVGADGTSRAQDDTMYIIDVSDREPHLLETRSVPGQLQGILPTPIVTSQANAPEEVWLSSNIGLFLWNAETDTWTLQYDWNKSGIGSTSVFAAYILPDETAVVLAPESMNDWSYQKGCIWRLGTADAVPEDDRTVVTLGIHSAVYPSLADTVNRFNQSSTDVRIEPVLYENTEDTLGMEMLAQDLLRGSAPDILVVGTEDLSAYVHKGLFVDLYGLLDADPQLNREDLVASVLAAGEINGTLPLLTPCYSVLTTAGSAAKLGTEMGWSWEEYTVLSAGYKTPIFGPDRTTLLLWQLQLGGSAFIDHDANKAKLTGPDFIRLLEVSAGYPQEMSGYFGADFKNRVAQGEILTGFQFVNRFDCMRDLVYQFDGPVVFKGFAGCGGSGSAFTATLQLGITGYCSQPEAAWQFLRTLLLPEYQRSLWDQAIPAGLPLRRDALRDMATAAEKPLASPQIYLGENPSAAEQEYWTRGITRGECEQILALIDATGTFYRYDNTIRDILSEESLNYYNGQCTAEAAAQYIQNRVQLYLDERA